MREWDTLRMLVEMGADVNTVFTCRLSICCLTVFRTSNTDTTSIQGGGTPLEAVSTAHDWEALRFLVERGADVSVLFTSALNLFLATAFAIDQQSVLTSPELDADGVTALEAAYGARAWPSFSFLAENGADPSKVFTGPPSFLV